MLQWVSAETLNSNGTTPLFEAVKQGALGSVRVLLSAGADPDNTGNQTISNVYRATMSGHLPIIRALIIYGAKPEKRHKREDLAFRAAVTGNPDIIKLLFENRHILPKDIDQDIIESAANKKTKKLLKEKYQEWLSIKTARKRIQQEKAIIKREKRLKRKYQEENHELLKECAICLDTINKAQKLPNQFLCEHGVKEFHDTCIRNHVETPKRYGNYCPLCRAKVKKQRHVILEPDEPVFLEVRPTAEW